MTRTCVVTGSASGIGRATFDRFESEGHRVIGVDVREAEIIADLSTPEGRASMVRSIEQVAEGRIDVVVANAGVTEPAERCVQVNFFGAVATLEGLRPLLARSDAARAVATASSSVLNENDPPTVEACLAGDEQRAVEVAAGTGLAAYPSTKRALARWVRRTAPTELWAGVGIALNAVAPGVVETPMTAPLLDDDAMRRLMSDAVPMPLGGMARPEHVAEAIAFLASERVERITGQVLFVDGGADVVLRGDDVW